MVTHCGICSMPGYGLKASQLILMWPGCCVKPTGCYETSGNVCETPGPREGVFALEAAVQGSPAGRLRVRLPGFEF